MPFQQTVRIKQTSGIVGEKAFEGPSRALPYFLNSPVADNNVFGRAFTVIDGIVDSPEVEAGGTGVFAGLMSNPKEHALRGTTAGTLEPTLTLPNGQSASFSTMDELYVDLGTAKATNGDLIAFLIADTAPGANDAGTLAPFAPGDIIPATHTQILGAVVIDCDTSDNGLTIVKLTDQTAVNPTA